MKHYAVLTGDLIGSSQIFPARRQELLAWLKKIARDFSALHEGVQVGELDVFRGDSWQICLRDPSLALWASVFLRVGLKAHLSGENVDTRVGIGVGTVDILSESRISESNGEAFIRSGRGLDSLAGDLNISLEWPDGPGSATVINQLVLPLLDLEISRWTYPEAVASFGALMGWTQSETTRHELARKKDGSAPSRQAISKALKRTCWSSHVQPVLEASSLFLKPQGEKQPEEVAND